MRHVIPPVVALLTCQIAAQTEDGREAYVALVREYDRAKQEWQREFNAAHRTTDTAKHAEVERRRPSRLFMPRFAGRARRYAGTEDAVSFLLWMLQNGRRGVGDPGAVLETLVRDHAESPQLAGVGREVRLMVAIDRYPRDRAAELLAELATRNDRGDVKISSHYYRAEMLHEVAGSADDRAVVAGAYRAVLACEPRDPFTPRAERGLYELEHLQVGMVAPEIAGEDLDGVAFKLSDYRGKVVLLDFWGDW